MARIIDGKGGGERSLWRGYLMVRMFYGDWMFDGYGYRWRGSLMAERTFHCEGVRWK